jgi:hypothetical protein
MVALSPLVFTLRNILDQIGLTSPARRNRVTRGTRLNHWQSMFAALGYWWWADANVAWRNEILLRDRPERFLTFCRDCGRKHRMRVSMSSALAGMPRYATADIAGNEA